ncbi:hypothetical protein E1287_32085 [Actinomadura sp. KC06]|uniref:hypothetical protein n=1 Tax=Actinomadura sp. KC06 TaxID=2530369 RepID=UPI001045D12E|nr:hypothetical protein [Actinomadura sp. KC06]TDD28851.1 hypothetical protein E1287_32085 [Actinomadura sp. KC06]
MGGQIDPVGGEVAAVELAARIAQALRATGQYQARYTTQDERAVLQRAGRIARATVKPRRITVRSGDGLSSRRGPTPRRCARSLPGGGSSLCSPPAQEIPPART